VPLTSAPVEFVQRDLISLLLYSYSKLE